MGSSCCAREIGRSCSVEDDSNSDLQREKERRRAVYGMLFVVQSKGGSEAATRGMGHSSSVGEGVNGDVQSGSETLRARELEGQNSDLQRQLQAAVSVRSLVFFSCFQSELSPSKSLGASLWLSVCLPGVIVLACR